jgi:hypothetical protein
MTAFTIGSPAPSTATVHPPNILAMMFHALGRAFVALMTSSPVTAVVVVIGLLIAITGFVRQVIHSGHSRDPVRRFRGAEKATLLTRAGGRFERHSPLVGRCKQTERLEADHIHPWSRGGQTAIANGQILCRRHNREKRAAVPFQWHLRAIERRRMTYYPAGIRGTVTRHAPPPPRKSKRPARRTPTA